MRISPFNENFINNSLTRPIQYFQSQSKLLQIKPNIADLLSKHFPTYPNTSQSIQTLPNLSKHFPTYPNLSRPIQTYPLLSKPIQTYPNLSKPIQAYQNLFKKK